MVALKAKKWGTTEFLSWSAQQEKRYELDGGDIVEMASEQARHALTKYAATKALEFGMKRAGLACQVYPDGMTVVVDDSHVRLPDAAVQCTPVDPESITLDNPVILVEVISPSSVDRDESQKLIEYFSIPSVSHYLVLSPNQRRVVHFKRGDQPGKIDTMILSHGSIDLSPPGFSVDVDALLGSSDR